MYLMGMPFLRRRKSTLIDGAADDATDLSDHLAVVLGARPRHPQRSQVSNGSRLAVIRGRRTLCGGARGQADLERVEGERHQRVVADQRDELDHPSIAEEAVRGGVGVGVEAAVLAELLRGGGTRARSSSVVIGGSSPRPIASITSSLTPCWRAIGTCAHHSNSDFHRAPVVMIASSSKRRSTELPERRCQPSSAARRPSSGACSHGLNGPRRPPSSSMTADERVETIKSHRAPPVSSRSSRRRGGSRLMTRSSRTRGRETSRTRSPSAAPRRTARPRRAARRGS